MEKLDKSLDKKPLEAPHTGIFFGVISGSPVGGAGLVDALVFGGSLIGGAGGGDLSSSEEWNGTSWSSGGSLTTAREAGGSCGDGSSNARFVGGYVTSPAPYPLSNLNEQYNGTSWASDTVLPVTNNNLQSNMDGSVDDCIIINGHANGTGDRNMTYVWNGSAWTSKATNSTSSAGSCTGTPTNCLSTHGTSSWYFNGSSWSSRQTLNTYRGYPQHAGTSSSSVMLSGGGNGVSSTESYNGSSWTTGNSMVTAVSYAGSCGSSSTNCMVAGGYNFTTHVNTVQDCIDGTWQSGTALTTSRMSLGGAGA
jgi:hypothetical protein